MPRVPPLSQVLLAPCPHASGAEARLVQSFEGVDRCMVSGVHICTFECIQDRNPTPLPAKKKKKKKARSSTGLQEHTSLPACAVVLQAPAEFLRLLLLGQSPPGWDWSPKGVCVFLGGDQAFTVRVPQCPLFFKDTDLAQGCCTPPFKPAFLCC